MTLLTPMEAYQTTRPSKEDLEIPEKFHELYEKIIDDQVFSIDKWYKYPRDPFQAEFIEWYSWRTMNLDFTDTRSHFKINSFVAMLIPKWSHITRTGTNHPLTQARSPERLQAQKEYWENFWNNRHAAIERAYDENEIDELSTF